MEGVEIAAGIFEVLDPFLGLGMEVWLAKGLAGKEAGASECVCHGLRVCNAEGLEGGFGKVLMLTSAIIIWQSKVPRPLGRDGRSTCGRTFVTTGAPKVMLGTKWPSIWPAYALGACHFLGAFSAWMVRK